MNPTQKLVDDIYRERVERARRMTVDEKLLAPAELFEWACQITRDGIRQQHPEADDAAVEAILRERLALGERLESLR